MLLIVSFLDILPTRVATDKSVHALDMLEVNTFMVKCCIALGTRNVLPAMFPLHMRLKGVFWIFYPTKASFHKKEPRIENNFKGIIHCN